MNQRQFLKRSLILLILPFAALKDESRKPKYLESCRRDEIYKLRFHMGGEVWKITKRCDSTFYHDGDLVDNRRMNMYYVAQSDKSSEKKVLWMNYAIRGPVPGAPEFTDLDYDRYNLEGMNAFFV